MTYLSKWKAKNEDGKKEILSQACKIIICVFVFTLLFYIFHKTGGTP